MNKRISSKLIVRGPVELNGEIEAQGDKTSALLMIACACALKRKTTLHGLPQVKDVSVGLGLASQFRGIRFHEDSVIIDEVSNDRLIVFSPESCKAIRHTISFVAAVLSLGKDVEFSLPGGDAFCERPVNLHFDAIRMYGAEILEIAPGRFIAEFRKKQKFQINLFVSKVGPSVGATCTALILAGSVSEKSSLFSFSIDPQVIPVVKLLSDSGCVIVRGDNVLYVERKNYIGSLSAEIPRDRIVVANAALLAAACGGKITVLRCDRDVLDLATRSIFEKMGISYVFGEDEITFHAPGKLSEIHATTAPFPGLSTDIMPLLAAASGCITGTSYFTENVYPKRISHLSLLSEFGVENEVIGSSYLVRGNLARIRPSVVSVGDIRAAGAALQLGMVANGVSIIDNYNHLNRGYERWVEQLISLGADIEVLETEIQHEMHKVLPNIAFGKKLWSFG